MEANPRIHLAMGEPHPAAWKALRYVRSKTPVEMAMLMEAFSSNAIEGNRVAEICAETLRRVMNEEPVSDRYILGLAWTLRDMEEHGTYL
jgi:hypothetical protein